MHATQARAWSLTVRESDFGERLICILAVADKGSMKLLLSTKDSRFESAANQ